MKWRLFLKWYFAGAGIMDELRDYETKLLFWKLVKVSKTNSSSNHLKNRKVVGEFGIIQGNEVYSISDKNEVIRTEGMLSEYKTFFLKSLSDAD